MARMIMVGTSGWMYKHWNKTFYEEAGKENQLVFYSREFNTVELNYSFYRMPGPKAYLDWYDRTPSDFKFTIKMNRFITHLKRLIIDDESKATLDAFLQDTQGLREKLSVILIQLQPSQSIDLSRLKVFLEAYQNVVDDLEHKPAACIEFRNTSWFTDETFRLLSNYNVALVFPSTPEFRVPEFTSNFAFIRIHGNKSYTDDELTELKNEIDNYPPKIREVFVYFNNDWHTYAIYNARFLKSLL
jgi:uncharacterized protein YecE (DUF72 family)